MDKKAKKYFIIVLISTFIIMTYTIASDFDKIVKMFSQLNMFWFAIAVMLMLTFNVLDSLFIVKYCKQYVKKYTFWMGLKVQQVGIFFSAITPFSSGGQLVQALLLKKQKINSKQSASMLMLSFISYQTVLVIISSLFLIIKFNEFTTKFPVFFVAILVGFLVNFVVIVGLFLSAFSKSFHKFIFKYAITFLGKIKIIKNVEKVRESTQTWLTLFRDEFLVLMKHKDLMIYRVSVDIAKLIVYYSIPFFCILAFNYKSVSFELYFTTLILTCFVQMLCSFIPTPGATLGVEATFLTLFKEYIPYSLTISVILLWRFVTYYLPMLLGFVVFANAKELNTVEVEEEEVE